MIGTSASCPWLEMCDAAWLGMDMPVGLGPRYISHLYSKFSTSDFAVRCEQ